MRIIAGQFASRKLETKKGNSTRPTLDKVKEAVFSSLGSYFEGGNVLDLYAGSGAIGLEALSRGMDHAYFSDTDHVAYEIIQKNIRSLGVEDLCDCYCMSDFKMLQKMKDERIRFDFVYLDPPYRKQKNEKILRFLDENDMIALNGTVVIESLKEESYDFKDLVHVKYRKEVVYGIMKITYYKHSF